MQKFEFDSGVLNGGLNNTDDDSLIEKNQISDGQNFVYDNAGLPEKRPPIVSQTTANPAFSTDWATGIEEGSPAETVFTEELYAYKKSTGAEFLIAFAGTTVKYTTDLSTWTSLNPDGVAFNTTQKMRFCTYKDKLIMSNGIDSVYYWDGSMAHAEKIGAPYLEASESGTTVTDGVHKFKFTYEIGTVIYEYGVTSEITVTDNKDVEISNIPLGPDDIDETKRKIWVTKAGGSTYYLLDDAALSATATTATLDSADDTIDDWTAYTTYVATLTRTVTRAVPKCRFFSVFENTLFGAHSLDAPSTVFWSDPNSFEDFRGTAFQGIDVDDGDYITGMIVYKANNRLIVTKKKALYGIFATSDSYGYASLSGVGCTFADSLKEFHIADEFGERDVLMFANNDGVWEWNGNTVRQTSDQPGRSSIQALWGTVKQREVSFNKDIKTTQGELENGLISASTDYPNNYTVIDGAAIKLKNVFSWNADAAVFTGARAFAWDSENSRLYFLADGGTGAQQLYYTTWDTANNRWSARTGAITGTSVYDARKMEYDATTKRLYVIGASLFGDTTIGKIYRTNMAKTAWEADEKTIDMTSVTGAISPPSSYYAVANGNYVISMSGKARLQYRTVLNTSVDIVKETSTTNQMTKYLYVPTRTTITNNATAKMYYKRWTSERDFMHVRQINNPVPEVLNYDGEIDARGTAVVSPGLYSFIVIESLVVYTSIPAKYTRAGNADIKIAGGKLFYTGHATETFGTTAYPLKKLYYIDLLNWGTPVFVGNVGRSYAYFGDVITYPTTSGGDMLSISYSDEINGFTSRVRRIRLASNTLYDEVTQWRSTTYEILRHRVLRIGTGVRIFAEAIKNADGKRYIGKQVGGTSFVFGDTEVNMFDTALKNFPLLMNAETAKFYYINADNFKIYEAEIGSDTVVDLGQANAGITDYRPGILLTGVADGVPDQIVACPVFTGNAFTYWRGIVGNYYIEGKWLITGTDKIDTGVDSTEILTLVGDEANMDGTKAYAKYYLATRADTDSYDHTTLNTMQEVQLGAALEGVGELTLKGDVRYVHEYITLYLDVAAIMTNSAADSWKSPTVNSVILSYASVVGSTTIPVTEAVAVTYKNDYYMAFVEPRPTDTTGNLELSNNVIARLDRFKRWTIWRGRGCFASTFAVYKDRLYWGDCFINASDEQSDYIYTLGTKAKNALADLDVEDGTWDAIDTYIDTMNYSKLADYDSYGHKKEIRHMWVTSKKYVSDTPYYLSIGRRTDDARYTTADGTNAVGDKLFTYSTMAVTDSVVGGKLNARIDFPLEQPGKVYQYRFRNNNANQDFGLIKFTLTGRILHRRD